MNKLKQKNKRYTEPLFWIYFAVITPVFLYLYHKQVLNAMWECTGWDSDLRPLLQQALGVENSAIYTYRFLIDACSLATKIFGVFTGAALVLTATQLVCALSLKYCLSREFERIDAASWCSHRRELVTICCIACQFVACLIVPKVTGYIYLGTSSPNVYHNPTSVAAKWVDLIAFFLMVHLLEDPERKPKWTELLALVASTMMIVYCKPTYGPVYYPVYAVFMLIALCKKGKAVFLNLVKIGAALIPSCLFMLYQMLSTFSEGIGISPGEVWGFYTNSIAVSALCGIAFPLCVTIFNRRTALKNRALQFAWGGYVMAFLQYYLLVQNGKNAGHANWSWGYSLALFILFAAAMPEYLKNKPDKPIKAEFVVQTVLLILHLALGLAYFAHILKGGFFAYMLW